MHRANGSLLVFALIVSLAAPPLWTYPPPANNGPDAHGPDNPPAVSDVYKPDPPATASICDVTGDGNTTVSDVQLEIDEALGSAAAANDLKNDGLISVVDVQIVINAVLGLGCSPVTAANPTLTITTSGTGAGTVGTSLPGTSCGSGCLSFAAGTAVTLTVTPSTGSTFAGWSGACSGTGGCIVTLNSSEAVTAAFNLAASVTSVTGTAAAGSPIAGAAVTLADSTGKSSTATTATDGSYALSTTGMTPPFLVQVRTANGNLYSVSADALTATTINTHPFTDLIIRSWYSAQGQNIDSAFSSPVSLPAPAPASVQLLNTTIANIAQLWLNNAGVNNPQFNLISSPFAANGTGLDQVLDETTVNTGAGTVTIAAGGTTEVSVITYNSSASTMTVSSTTTNSNGASVNSSTTVVPTQAAQQAALNGIAATWTEIANAVNSNGSQLTAAELIPFLAADLLDDGLNQSQFAASLATDFRGISLSPVQIQSVNSIDLVNGFADIVFNVTVTQGAQTQTMAQELWFEDVSGTWLIGGDKRIANIGLLAETRTMEGASQEIGSGTFVDLGVEAPTGTVTGASVTDASGVTGWNSAPLGQESGIFETFQPTPTTTLNLILDHFVIASNLGSNLVPAGTLFTLAVTPASGPVVNYALFSNVFTTESISITSPTSGALSSYTLGQPLTMTWTLPTTFPIAQVKINAEALNGPPSSTSTLTCFSNGPQLGNNASSGAVTIPATCGGLPVTNGVLTVNVTGVNGESAYAAVFFQ